MSGAARVEAIPRTSALRRRAQPAARYAFRTFAGLEGLSAARDAWTFVADRLGQRSFVHLPDWHEAFARELAADPAALRTFVAYASGEPVGVFPLVSCEQRLGGVRLRALELPRHDHLSFSDLVFRAEGHGDLLSEFVHHLDGDAPERWDVLLLHELLEDGAASRALRAVAPSRVIVQHPGKCDYLDVVPFEERLEGFSKNFRGALRKARNKLALEPEVELVRAGAPAAVAAALEEFFAVEGSGWKGAAGSAIRSDARLAGFYRSVAARFSELGACELNLLRIGGRCVAAQFCLRVDRCLYILKIGYDEARSKLAPGNLLLEHVLRRCGSERDVDVVNLLSGAAWHGDWNPRFHRRFSAIVFTGSARARASRLALRGQDRLRPLVRRCRELLSRRDPAPAAPGERR